jgi:diguanylate cyclase
MIAQRAARDAMTGTWNRRQIDALLASELERKSRLGGEVCVCLLDLDYFKSINDRFGHLSGDAVLAEVARRMKASLRTIDQLGRFGGEEFLVVLPGTSLREAMVCAERLRCAVGQMTVPDHPEAALSISIGLAAAEAGEASSSLLTRVDAALYAAKHAGRDCIVVAPGTAGAAPAHAAGAAQPGPVRTPDAAPV